MQANNPKGNKQLPKSIKIGHLEIPEDYFKLHSVDKETICIILMEQILNMIEKQIPSYINKIEFLDKVLESSIITNVQEEQYEVAQVLTDIKQMIND
jgi:hypothetical protein